MEVVWVNGVTLPLRIISVVSNSLVVEVVNAMLVSVEVQL